jgi:hypothetical protein
MKYIFFLILSSYFAFSSSAQIEVPTRNYKKIIFKYETKPNFYFKKDSVFADTFLLKKEFPRINYILKKSHKDSIQNIGYILKENMNAEEKANLSSIIFHLYHQITYTYTIKSKKTKAKGSSCMDSECKNIFKLFFNKNSPGTTIFPSTVKYNDEHDLMTNNTYSGLSHEEKYPLIKWSEEFENVGFYDQTIKNHNSDDLYKYTNVILFNPDLDRHINPIHLFKNCNYGVRKTISKYSTTTLLSVKYK